MRYSQLPNVSTSRRWGATRRSLPYQTRSGQTSFNTHRGTAVMHGWADEQEIVRRMFYEEGLLPVQVPVARARSPFIALYWAMLLDAVRSVQGLLPFTSTFTHSQGKNQRGEDRRWLLGLDERPLPCADLCAVLGVEYECLRRWVERQ